MTPPKPAALPILGSIQRGREREREGGEYERPALIFLKRKRAYRYEEGCNLHLNGR